MTVRARHSKGLLFLLNIFIFQFSFHCSILNLKKKERTFFKKQKRELTKCSDVFSNSTIVAVVLGITLAWLMSTSRRLNQKSSLFPDHTKTIYRKLYTYSIKKYTGLSKKNRKDKLFSKAMEEGQRYALAHPKLKNAIKHPKMLYKAVLAVMKKMHYHKLNKAQKKRVKELSYDIVRKHAIIRRDELDG